MALRDWFRRNRSSQSQTNPSSQNNPPASSGNSPSQSQSRDYPIYITNVVQNVGHRNFWWFFLIVAAIFIAGWVLKWYKIFSFKVFWILVFFVFVLYGFISFFYKKDLSKLFIAGAFSLWIADFLLSTVAGNIPGLKGFALPPWAGFVWDKDWSIITNLPTIVTSGLVFAFLYINMLYDIVKKDNAYIFSFIFIVISNILITKYFPQKWILPYGALAMIILVGILLAALIFFMYKFRKEAWSFYSYFFMIIVFSFFWTNRGWMHDVRAWAHAAYVLLFGYLYVVPRERENPVFWHLFIPLLLILDFFGFSLLYRTNVVWLQNIPILVLVVLTYCYYSAYNYEHRENIYALMSYIFIITILLILSLDTRSILPSGGEFSYIPNTGPGFSGFLNEITKRMKGTVEERLDIATAGLYRGNVEQNKYENLGVYFNNIRAADPRFYTEDPITIWSSIRSKTYKDPVVVKYNCSLWEDSKRIYANKIEPKFAFPIFSSEEVDTECTFYKTKTSPDLKPGAKTVTLTAEYNFGTDAYLKTYFIDRDRFRAYSREDIDPLDEFDINDKNPAAVYTNGPVEIGIGAGPLIPVAEGYTIKPTIGITIGNRGEIHNAEKKMISKWDGKIKNITELVLLLPPGIVLSNLNSCGLEDEEKFGCPCNMPFKEYKADDCISRCAEEIKPCKKVCTEIYDRAEEQKFCSEECDLSKTKCENNCKELFSTEGEGSSNGNYNGYELVLGSLKFRDLNKDIDRFRSFQCRLDVSPNVLDSSPLTTRYFRARVKYNYLLENSVQINVYEAPTKSLLASEEFFRSAVESKDIRFDIKSEGIDPDLLVAIAYVESSMRHCCQRAEETRAESCARSDEISCPPNKIISSGSSIGVMQIHYYDRKDPAKQEKIQQEIKAIAKRVCDSEKTVFDLDCNVKIGATILKDKYNLYKDGCKESSYYKTGDRAKYRTFFDACDNGISSKSGARFDSYRGVEAAIRGYNGWGLNGGDSGYVEKVMETYGKIKAGIIRDETGIKNLISSREGEGMAYEEYY